VAAKRHSDQGLAGRRAEGRIGGVIVHEDGDGVFPGSRIRVANVHGERSTRARHRARRRRAVAQSIETAKSPAVFAVLEVVKVATVTLVRGWLVARYGPALDVHTVGIVDTDESGRRDLGTVAVR